MATGKTEIAALVRDINIYAEKLLHHRAGNEKEAEDDEGARQSLVQAAEKLAIASRRPDENLYATATNVWLFWSCSGEPPTLTLTLFSFACILIVCSSSSVFTRQ